MVECGIDFIIFAFDFTIIMEVETLITPLGIFGKSIFLVRVCIYFSKIRDLSFEYQQK